LNENSLAGEKYHKACLHFYELKVIQNSHFLEMLELAYFSLSTGISFVGDCLGELTKTISDIGHKLLNQFLSCFQLNNLFP